MELEPLGFTAKEADDEVGVTYFGERYLIARIGRWASPDPLHVHAVGGGEALNSYHYVAGNLLQGRDPIGLEDYGDVPATEDRMAADQLHGHDISSQRLSGSDAQGEFDSTDVTWADMEGITITADPCRAGGGTVCSPEVTQAREVRAAFHESATSAVVGTVTLGVAPALDQVRQGNYAEAGRLTYFGMLYSSAEGVISTASNISAATEEGHAGDIARSTLGGQLFGTLLATVAMSMGAGFGGGGGGGGGGGRGGRGNIVYRQLSAADRAALEAGEGISPRGTGGSIADQVAGRDTRYISASETAEAAQYYSSGHGLIAIDIDRAIELGTGYVEHNNVLSGVRRGGTARDIGNASRAREVLFKGPIPIEAIWPLRDD